MCRLERCLLSAAFLAAGSLAGWACGSSNPNACSVDADCTAGVCHAGSCVDCEENEDCNRSGRCVDFSCVPRESCATAPACSEGVCVDGLCMDCRTDDDCLDGKYCIDNVCVSEASDRCQGYSSCSGHGTCDDSSGQVVCTCNQGYAGDRCERCAVGYQDYGDGDCRPSDPCAGDQACAADHRECQNDQGVARCGDCLAGYHEGPGGACVLDAECQAGTCSNRGTCDDSSGAPVCTCDPGYAGEHCENCAAGYQDYGDGDCRPSDPCAGDQACAADHRECQNDQGVARCGNCLAGYHEDGTGACVVDQTCQASTCSGHGSCDDSGGAPVCTCEQGYAGAHCEACAQGFAPWPPGSDTCLPDPCQPDPCDLPNAVPGSCLQTGEASFDCSCQPGYAWYQGACVGTCVDGDGDHYGVGPACLGPDCDDTSGAVHPGADELCNGLVDDCEVGTDVGFAESDLDQQADCVDPDDDDDGDPDETDCAPLDPAIHHGAAEACNGLDDDCDDAVDEELDPPACPLGLGVCAGVVPVCQGQAGWSACDYGPDYEADDELSCDGLDNDCDDLTDELVPRACSLSNQHGTCHGTEVCQDAGWLCDAQVPAAEVTCDQLDNDCDPATPDDPDADGDSVSLCAGDCNDAEPLIWEPGQISLYNVHLAGGGSTVAVDPGVDVTVSADWAVTQVAGCPACIDQLLFGLYAEGYWHEPQHCQEIGIPASCPGFKTGHVDFHVRAPRTPGVYDIRAGLALTYNCGEALNSYLAWVAGRDDVLGTITVRQPACSSWLHYYSDLGLAGGGPEVTVAPGAPVAFDADFFFAQTSGCPACIDQLVVGIEGDAQICHHLGIPPLCPGTSGTTSGTLTAPNQPGTYLVKYMGTMTYNCGEAQAAYENNPPGREWTYGVIHVE